MIVFCVSNDSRKALAITWKDLAFTFADSTEQHQSLALYCRFGVDDILKRNCQRSLVLELNEPAQG